MVRCWNSISQFYITMWFRLACVVLNRQGCWLATCLVRWVAIYSPFVQRYMCEWGSDLRDTSDSHPLLKSSLSPSFLQNRFIHQSPTDFSNTLISHITALLTNTAALYHSHMERWQKPPLQVCLPVSRSPHYLRLMTWHLLHMCVMDCRFHVQAREAWCIAPLRTALPMRTKARAHTFDFKSESNGPYEKRWFNIKGKLSSKQSLPPYNIGG